MALLYGRYSNILMSLLLSLHPIKTFERQKPESVSHVTSRQRGGGRVSVCEWEANAERTREDEEAARQKKQPHTLSRRPGSYLITGNACWERTWTTTRTEGQKQPGASQDMISKIIKAKTPGEEASTITTWNSLFTKCLILTGSEQILLWLKLPSLFDVLNSKCQRPTWWSTAKN